MRKRRRRRRRKTPCLLLGYCEASGLMVECLLLLCYEGSGLLSASRERRCSVLPLLTSPVSQRPPLQTPTPTWPRRGSRGRDAAEAPQNERCWCSCGGVFERPWHHHDVSHREETLTLLLGDRLKEEACSPFAASAAVGAAAPI